MHDSINKYSILETHYFTTMNKRKQPSSNQDISSIAHKKCKFIDTYSSHVDPPVPYEGQRWGRGRVTKQRTRDLRFGY